MTLDESKEEIVHPQLREKLEKMEIEAPGCTPPPEVYSKLLAIYIYEDDLCNAKFLWKRIPASVKSEYDELPKVWEVGKSIWKRDPPAVFESLQSHQWSDNIDKIMNEIKVRMRKRFVSLVGKAYTSITLKDFSHYVGIPENEAIQIANEQQGWSYDPTSQMVLPARGEVEDDLPVPADLQLSTLTDFVTFFEK